MFSATLPWTDEVSLKETLQRIPEVNSLKLQIRPDLTYVEGTHPEAEIREELEPQEAVAVILETHEASKKVVDLEEKIQAYRDKIKAYLDAIVVGQAERTSKFTKCPSCGSAVSVQHIKSIHCPVCGSAELLMTNTHHKKLDGYRSYINDYTARLELARISAKSKVISKSWLVVAN